VRDPAIDWTKIKERQDNSPECRDHEGVYRLLSGHLYYDRAGNRSRILSFCLDDPEQGPVVIVPIFPIGVTLWDCLTT